MRVSRAQNVTEIGVFLLPFFDFRIPGKNWEIDGVVCFFLGKTEKCKQIKEKSTTWNKKCKIKANPVIYTKIDLE